LSCEVLDEGATASGSECGGSLLTESWIAVESCGQLKEAMAMSLGDVQPIPLSFLFTMFSLLVLSTMFM